MKQYYKLMSRICFLIAHYSKDNKKWAYWLNKAVQYNEKLAYR